MSIQRDRDELTYRSRRRAPGPPGAGHDVRVVVGEELEHQTEFDHYLTARFTLWNVAAGQILRTRAEHPPWVLRRATLLECREDLLAAAGLPAPDEAAIAHYSDGVDVRIGAPRRVRR